MIYIASPYSHDLESVRELRAQHAAFACARLFDQGEHPFSPIVHGHEIQKYMGEDSTAFEVWQAYCAHTLSLCEKMYIVDMDGWQESKGVSAEVELCRESGTDVYIYNPFHNTLFYPGGS